MRQPSLFNFKPTEQMRNSGLTPEEERQLIMFCLSDDYPRTHTVERTGTKFTLACVEGAQGLLKRLRFGTKSTRQTMTQVNQMRLQ
jgi:hypothetical protein